MLQYYMKLVEIPKLWQILVRFEALVSIDLLHCVGRLLKRVLFCLLTILKIPPGNVLVSLIALITLKRVGALWPVFEIKPSVF